MNFLRSSWLRRPSLARGPCRALTTRHLSFQLSGAFMPLTVELLQEIQSEAFADDVEIELERMRDWTPDEVKEYFASGGKRGPTRSDDVPITPATDAALAASARFAGSWLVADMDSTLIRKERSVYGTLDESPCRGPLIEWLSGGGSLCVVTSDDGLRPFEQLWNQIPSELRTRVAISTSDGAALFRGDAQGRPQEDERYWQVAQGGINEDAVEPLMAIAHDMYCSLIDDCLGDQKQRKALLDLLSGRDAAAVGALLDEASKAGGAESVLSHERLTRSSGVLSRGALVWRNQAGPVSSWKRDTTFVPIPAKGREWNFVQSVAVTQPGAKYTNCFMMCFPRAISAKYIERFAGRLAALGCVASAAPNSVCLKSATASKALPIEWLCGAFPGAPAAALNLDNAVAFGDNPCGNDEPLTTFAERGMRFVSVANSAGDELPVALQPYHVGGVEEGTARVLSRLVETGADSILARLKLGDAVREICAALRREAAAAAHGHRASRPVTGDEQIMSQKAHGTSRVPVQDNLRWNCDRDTADRICSACCARSRTMLMAHGLFARSRICRSQRRVARLHRPTAAVRRLQSPLC